MKPTTRRGRTRSCRNIVALGRREAERIEREERLNEARRIVATGKCPKCGTALKANTSITGWWQCEASINPEFRKPENRTKPPCSFQCFTQ